MSRSSEGQGDNDECLWKGHDLSNNLCEYEVNPLPNEFYLRGKRNFNGNCLRRRAAAQPPGHIFQAISQNFLPKIRLIRVKVYFSGSWHLFFPGELEFPTIIVFTRIQ